MKIKGTRVNLTPIFRLEGCGKSADPWRRVSGALSADNGWLFPAYYPFGKAAFKDLRIVAPHLQWDPSTAEHLALLSHADKHWIAAKDAFQEKRPVPFPFDLSFPKGFEPYQHQLLGIQMIALWWRAFLLWEMGTGKTRTMIDGFRLSRRENPEVRRMLVLAPPVVLPTWVAEVDRCSQGEMRAVIWDGTDKTAEAAQTADVVAVSYARVRIEADPKKHAVNRLLNLDYQVIVGDESHSIGNFESDQTRAALQLSAKASRRYLLSGTAADHPGKLYPQLRFLSPTFLPMNWMEYKNTYFVLSQFQRGRVFGYKHMDDLNSRVDQIASRMKKKDCIDLPPVTFVDVPFQLTEEQSSAYDACIARLRDYDLYKEKYEGQGVSVVHGASLVNKLLQVISGFALEGADPMICDGCQHLVRCVDMGIKPYTEACQLVKIKPPTTVRRFSNYKLSTFKDLIDGVLQDDPTNKVIVWATYLEELNDIENVVKDLGYGYVRIDGKNTNKIKDIAHRFQTDENCRVYVGQVMSGVGVTLTAANFMVYYSLTWNLTAYKQSLERNNRPGQTRNMTVYRLLSTYQNALDRFLAATLQFKDNVAYTMLERIACAGCDRVKDCAAAEIKPFTAACKYSAQVSKPQATAEYLGVKRAE